MLNPALIGRAELGEVLIVLSTTVVGIVLISGGLQGYLYGIGAIRDSAVGWIGRALLVVGGIIMALPGNSQAIGYSHMQINTTAAAIIILGIAVSWMGRRPQSSAQPV